MKLLKKTTLAAAITSALALGMSGQAMAEVYAGSQLLVNNFVLTFAPTTNIAVTGYSFTANSNANLNGVNGQGNADCSTIGTACTAGNPVLSSVANAPGSNPARALGDFSLWGPGSGDTYSNSAAEIFAAELVNATPTVTKQISEVEIAGSGKGDSNTNVGSQTTLVFNFSLGQTADLSITFDADPYLFVSVNTPNLISALAQASISSNFELTGSNGVQITWAPNGITAGNSLFDFTNCSGVVSCSEDDDEVSLNATRSLFPGNPSSNGFSTTSGLSSFGISVNGLTAGTYTLALSATTFARAEQLVQRVPEPGMLALLGIGLAGLGFATRRRVK